MVFAIVGDESNMPNKIGIFAGTKAHIRINFGIWSPESGEIAELTILRDF